MTEKKYTVSKRIGNIPEALSIYVNQLVYAEKRKGIDIITLSLGESFFDIPQYSFDEIDFERGYHYSDSMGLPDLRKQIMNYYNNHYDAKINGIDQILISSGSKVIIFMIMQAILNEGDEVLIHEPAWLSYQEQAKLVGAIPRFIPYDCEVKDFEHHFTDKTKLLILNNPNNPAGWLYTEEELRQVYSICQNRSVYILMDEAYSDFIDEGEEFCSLAKVSKDLDGVFVVNSLSKNMGMSGWRVGYVISNKESVKDLLKLNEHIITCAPTVLQMYLSRFFDDIIEVTMPQVRDVVKKRARVVDYMKSIGLDCLIGSCTFYIFVSVDGIKADVMTFCLYLLFKYGIAVVPGGAYGKSTERFVRVGIGVESEERIHYALNIIKTVIEENLTDSGYVEEKLRKNGFHKFEEIGS